MGVPLPPTLTSSSPASPAALLFLPLPRGQGTGAGARGVSVLGKAGWISTTSTPGMTTASRLPLSGLSFPTCTLGE